jgi:hypothetical protein
MNNKYLDFLENNFFDTEMLKDLKIIDESKQRKSRGLDKIAQLNLNNSKGNVANVNFGNDENEDDEYELPKKRKPEQKSRYKQNTDKPSKRKQEDVQNKRTIPPNGSETKVQITTLKEDNLKKAISTFITNSNLPPSKSKKLITKDSDNSRKGYNAKKSDINNNKINDENRKILRITDNTTVNSSKNNKSKNTRSKDNAKKIESEPKQLNEWLQTYKGIKIKEDLGKLIQSVDFRKKMLKFKPNEDFQSNNAYRAFIMNKTYDFLYSKNSLTKEFKSDFMSDAKVSDNKDFDKDFKKYEDKFENKIIDIISNYYGVNNASKVSEYAINKGKKR